MPLTPPEVNRLLAKIVLINLGLYIGIIQLYNFGVLFGDSVFPSLVLFLCFSISIGNLFIVGIGEKVDLSKVQNEWIRKIGVTPIMVVVAVLITLLAGFSPLANLIVPATKDKDQFLLAKVGVSCNASNLVAERPRATKLLVFIWSQDDDYIKEIDNFLQGRPNTYVDWLVQQVGWKRDKAFPEIEVVNKENAKDVSLTLLRQFANTPQVGSDGLTDQLSNKDHWIAYTHKVNDPNDYTFIPVPTIYEKRHITRTSPRSSQRARES